MVEHHQQKQDYERDNSHCEIRGLGIQTQISRKF